MRLLGLLLLLASVGAAASPAPGSVTLDRATLGRLDALRPGDTLVLPAFPAGPGVLASVRLERVDIYAPGAHIVEVGPGGEREVPRSRRIELIGSGIDSDMRVSLSFDPGFGRVRGSGSDASGAYAIIADQDGSGLHLHAIAADQALPRGVVPHFDSRHDSVPSGQPMPSELQLHLARLAEPLTGEPRVAVLAIDTDTEFMAERFANGSAAATDWIADLFGVMNVMYERDLDVRLSQGTTYLRTGSDPYSASDTPADMTDLNEFGSYWQAHYANVPRSFAMLLSGKSSSANYASGIAWINSYCHTQSNGGSYSVNQVFMNSAIPVDLSALITGHELGHNLGAWHTHCTDASTGGAPAATNTVDQCFNGEASQGCYSGPTSCPTSGPGHPLGTIMSYCNLNSCGGQNVMQFHPTEITKLSALISANTPSCLTEGGDALFANGFE
ncbi:MAG: M12 family metallo-peptidase [Rhodanobacteraceae bacterium]